MSMISSVIIVYPKLNSEHRNQLHCSQTLFYGMCDTEYITEGTGRVESAARRPGFESWLGHLMADPSYFHVFNS